METEELRQAAITAEIQTGEHEATEARAWHHVLIRVARMTLGFTVFGGGIAMLPLPGPGLPVLALGLAILARDFAWADRLLLIVRDKASQATEKTGRVGTILMLLTSACLMAFGIWWTWLR